MPTLVVDALRVDTTAGGHDIVDEVFLESRPGRCSDSSANPAPGRPPSGWPCSATPARAWRSPAGRSRSTTVRCSVSPWPSCAGPAATSSATSRRTRARPSTRRCASAPSCSRCSSITTSAAPTTPGADRVGECMAEVLLPATPQFLRRYPHQLSGGQQQRVGLAMAFACRPAVIVLDEPTTGLDVSTQTHVLATVRDLCRQHGVAALYITHDLAVVANLADRVAVMYAGRIVEQGPTAAIFARPAHPYSRHLIAAAPDITGDRTIVGLRGPRPITRPAPASVARSHCAASSPSTSAPRPSRPSPRSPPATRCGASSRGRCRSRGSHARRRSSRARHPSTPPWSSTTSRRRTPARGSCTTSTYTSSRASASPSSASRDRARRRSPGRSVASTTNGPGRFGSATRSSAALPGTARWSSG